MPTERKASDRYLRPPKETNQRLGSSGREGCEGRGGREGRGVPGSSLKRQPETQPETTNLDLCSCHHHDLYVIQTTLTCCGKPNAINMNPACLLFRCITVFALLRRYAETLYNRTLCINHPQISILTGATINKSQMVGLWHWSSEVNEFPFTFTIYSLLIERIQAVGTQNHALKDTLQIKSNQNVFVSKFWKPRFCRSCRCILIFHHVPCFFHNFLSFSSPRVSHSRSSRQPSQRGICPTRWQPASRDIWYPLVNVYIAILKMTIEIVDLPIKNMVIFHIAILNYSRVS